MITRQWHRKPMIATPSRCAAAHSAAAAYRCHIDANTCIQMPLCRSTRCCSCALPMPLTWISFAVPQHTDLHCTAIVAHMPYTQISSVCHPASPG